MAVSRVSNSVSSLSFRSPCGLFQYKLIFNQLVRSECTEFGETFCVLWATAGYSAQLALVPCLASLISLLFIFVHRGQLLATHSSRL